jgi:hypothetical protein
LFICTFGENVLVGASGDVKMILMATMVDVVTFSLSLVFFVTVDE